MKKTLVSLFAAVALCATVACAQTSQDGASNAPQNARQDGPRGDRGPGGRGFRAPGMGMMNPGAQLVALFGENLENADFPEGVWSINDQGELVATKDAVIWTKEKYSSFVCSFEFCLSEHTNGGFLIQCSDKDNWIPNTIEIQLLDDFGQEPDYHSCGSIYGFQAPSKNTTKKPGEWNEMCVVCMGREIAVYLNGEPINRINTAEWTDPAKSPAGTDIEEKFRGHSLASAEPFGFIGFQGLHGNSPMQIRNATIIPISHPDTTQEGWVSLFGDALENGEYDPAVWSIDAEGVMSAKTDAMIWAKEKYENFSLDFEFKTTEGANSGVVIQSTTKEGTDWIPNSLEIQVFDSFGRTVDMSDCGAVYGRCAPMFNACKPTGEWNRMTVNCFGGRITVILNGQLVTWMDKRQWTKADENPDGTKPFSWLINKAPSEMENVGFVGIQGLHGNEPVVFRNVKVRKMEFPRRPAASANR